MSVIRWKRATGGTGSSTPPELGSSRFLACCPRPRATLPLSLSIPLCTPAEGNYVVPVLVTLTLTVMHVP